jgi:hypothetical protein
MRLESEIKEAAEQAAKADHRSFSGLIRHLLAEHCATNGFLEKAPGTALSQQQKQRIA